MGKEYTEAKKRYINEYQKEHMTKLSLRFNNIHDADIIERLCEVPNKSGYIKDLIRKDIKEKS